MNKPLSKLLVLILTGITYQSFCQITINNVDMPASGDTFRISITNNLHGVDPTITGQGVSWDFSLLTPTSQTVDSFFGILSTYIPVTYNLVYNNPFDQAHQANVVTRSFNTMNPFPQVQISEMFNFFKSSSSGYTQVGQGAKVNGIPTAMKYDNAESFYKFPMQYGNVDSTVSKYGTSIPGLGYYGQTIKRVNLVDGYGTLTTPFGTFGVMRVKSLIYTIDTLYIDTILHYGTTINRPLETQYIWLGDNQGDPLLLISKTNNIPTVRYKDNIPASNAINSVFSNQSITLFPNPAKNILKITSDKKIGKAVISNMLGETLLIRENNFSDINISNLEKGIYLLRIYSDNRALLSVNKFIKE